VKEAGISKGLLFHYFHSKKDLFFFLYDYALDFFREEFFGKNHFDEGDILIRLRQMALVKLKLIKSHPEIYKFLLMAYIEESGEVKGELERRNKKLISDSFNIMYRNFDASKFREGVDIQLAIKVMAWTWEGFGNQELERLRHSKVKQLDCERLLAEADSYIKLFRECFYQQTGGFRE
jgi:TetR/AcrR family transcriptional regulator